MLAALPKLSVASASPVDSHQTQRDDGACRGPKANLLLARRRPSGAILCRRRALGSYSPRGVLYMSAVPEQ